MHDTYAKHLPKKSKNFGINVKIVVKVTLIIWKKNSIFNDVFP